MKLAVLNTVTCIFYVKYKQMYFDAIVLFRLFRSFQGGFSNNAVLVWTNYNSLDQGWVYKGSISYVCTITYNINLFLSQNVLLFLNILNIILNRLVERDLRII